MSNRKDHGLKEHGLSDDAIEAGHDFIHDAEEEEERRHSGDLNTMPSMATQQKKGVALEGSQPETKQGQGKGGQKA
ncbi:hypothetical protein CCHL11_07987 [Colletotrichum chlorophyti]|uniref:Uncharacterized protein n=1 Tax=Colletotrichum chlorophyti TaxID=708187 RepID=A0A1Q8RM39_9PEZI|nr:hypothetical protein CCHL11_07987 [Colletotrichum chlorophyti]